MAQKIDKREISRSEADRILQIEESHYIDVKAVETEPATLSEAVAAFSNTAGGELFIGIDEKTTDGKKTRNGAASRISRPQMIELPLSKGCLR
jgi:ATP-dependent DNA helicase RecG